MVAVSGIAIAGLAAFSASAGTSQAYAAQAPLGISSSDAQSSQTGLSDQEIADQRTAELNAQAAQLKAAAGDTASNERFQSLSETSAKLDSESERLKNIAKFKWPTAGSVSSGYGMRMHPILHYMRLHDGDDIGGTCGQPIWAAQSGRVVKAESGYNGGSGNNVRIDHGDINGVNVQTGYLHMSRYVVSVGEWVNKGDVVGYVGSTGLSTACHLHFSAYKNGTGTDPMQYIGWNSEAKS
jgi:murein DD-endopeptidase MepM/ murein hydrolase activator NlpD